MRLETIRSLRRTKISTCVDPFGRQFNSDHHLVKVCKKFLENDFVGAFEILEYYHLTFKPVSCEHAIGMNKGNNKFKVFEYPWGSFHLQQNTVKDIKKSRFCGPSSDVLVKQEFNDLKTLVSSIKNKGFAPIKNRAIIGRVDFKDKDKWVPIIIQGNHRVSCLSALGYKNVLTSTLLGYKSLIDCDDRFTWPAVVNSVCDADYALKFSSQFFS